MENIVEWFKNWNNEIKNFVLQHLYLFTFFPFFYDNFLFYWFHALKLFWETEYKSLLSKLVIDIKNITLGLSILPIICKIFEKFFM